MNEDPRPDPGLPGWELPRLVGEDRCRKEHRFSGFGRSPAIRGGPVESRFRDQNCTISAPFLRHQTSCAASRRKRVQKVDRFFTVSLPKWWGVSGEPLLIKGFVGVGQVFGKVFRPQGRLLFENQFVTPSGLGSSASGVSDG